MGSGAADPLSLAARDFFGVTPFDVVAGLWRDAGLKPAALNHLTLTGNEPALPSSFRVGCAAQASIALAGLAAAEVWHRRGQCRASM